MQNGGKIARNLNSDTNIVVASTSEILKNNGKVFEAKEQGKLVVEPNWVLRFIEGTETLPFSTHGKEKQKEKEKENRVKVSVKGGAVVDPER